MESKIKQNVMRRVHTVHTLRPLLSGGVLGTVVLAGSLFLIGRLVFVAQVFRNMPSLADATAVARFLLEAFVHTDFVVQALTLLVVLSLAWIARDIARVVAVGRTA